MTESYEQIKARAQKSLVASRARRLEIDKRRARADLLASFAIVFGFICLVITLTCLALFTLFGSTTP